MSGEDIHSIKTDIAALSSTFVSEMGHTRKNIDGMRSDQKEHSEKLNDMTRTIAVMTEANKNHEEEVACKFKEVDEKLGRDFHKLNELEKRAIKENGVAEFKSNSRNKVRYFLYVIATILGLAISFNTIAGIVKNINKTTEYRESRSN